VLTYEFPERRVDHAVAALEWENLAVPFTLTVDDTPDLYVENMKRELRSTAGFSWQGWESAAQYCLQTKTHLDQGLRWAEIAVHGPGGIGQENFTTLSTLSELQAANGKTAEAAATIDRALHNPAATPVEIHGYARQLLAEKKPEEALKVFELNARLHPDVWPVHLGLARGHAALGHTQEALAEAKLALPHAPDEPNRKAVQGMIDKLSSGKGIN
jgi:predicted Zn-dependent protease